MGTVAPSAKSGSAHARASDGAGRPARIVVLVILLAATIRVGLAAGTGLGVDESYWASVSRFPSLSFVDDAPMQAWIAAAARWLLGSEAPVALRLPFIALFAASTWLMFRLTALLFGARAGMWAAIALNLAPVFTLAHGAWLLPDGPLIFFELATACVLADILFRREPGDPGALPRWLAAGALGGCALLSKYHGVFIFIGALAFVLSVPGQRRWLRTAGPWLGVAVALVVFSPVIVWNAQHEWAGVAFQLDRIGPAAQHGPALDVDDEGSPAPMPWTGTVRMLGGAVLFLGWFIVPLAFAVVLALYRGRSRPDSWFLACLAIGPIAVFGTVGLWASQQYPHWPMPGWLLAFPMLGAAWAALEARRPAIARMSMAVWAATLLAGVGALYAHIRLDIPSFAALRPFLQSDPTVGLKDWEELRTTLAVGNLIDAATPAVATSHWMDAAKVAYALGRDVPVVCVCRVPQQFPHLHDPARFAGRNMIVVVDKLTNRRQQWLARHFSRLETLEPVPLHRAGAVVKTLKLYHAIGFDPAGARSSTHDRARPSRSIFAAEPRRPPEAVDCASKSQREREPACWLD